MPFLPLQKSPGIPIVVDWRLKTNFFIIWNNQITCKLTFASENGGLWVENFQIWGLVSWKFPYLEVWELKNSKFGGLWAKIWVPSEVSKGGLVTDSFAWNGTLARGVKTGSSGPYIPIPLSRSVPPPHRDKGWEQTKKGGLLQIPRYMLLNWQKIRKTNQNILEKSEINFSVTH